jgi:predicted alpha/beta hydrolase
MLVVPGLGSSASDSYVSHIVDEAKKKGIISALMHYRGIDTDLLNNRLYSAADYDDIEFAVKHVKSIYPNHQLIAVGFSFGNRIISLALISSGPKMKRQYSFALQKIYGPRVFMGRRFKSSEDEVLNRQSSNGTKNALFLIKNDPLFQKPLFVSQKAERALSVRSSS